ncbi:MAG: hypothetical protein AB1568_05810 [Thermodesulfobacteriota bacterium]
MRKFLQGIVVVALLGGSAWCGETGSITGRLVEADYGPARNGRIVFVPAAGQDDEVGRVAGLPPAGEVTAAANGWFVTSLAPGDYYIGIGRNGEGSLCFRTDGQGRLLRFGVAQGGQTDLGAMVVRAPGAAEKSSFFSGLFQGE